MKKVNIICANYVQLKKAKFLIFFNEEGIDIVINEEHSDKAGSRIIMGKKKNL